MATMIKAEYLEKLEAFCKHRGWTLVGYQNIPKVDEMTGRLVVILTYRPEDKFKYIVYTYNVDDNACHNGDYYDYVAGAWISFGTRVHRYWPTYEGVFVPEDAPEDYFKQRMEGKA